MRRMSLVPLPQGAVVALVRNNITTFVQEDMKYQFNT